MPIDPAWAVELSADVKKAFDEHQKHSADVSRWSYTLHNSYANRLGELCNAAGNALANIRIETHV